MDMTSNHTRRCYCGLPLKWAQDPDFPVVFDAQLREYRLVDRESRIYHRMRYCFWCGGQLPDRIESLANDSAEQPVSEPALELLSEATSAQQVLQLLGQLDKSLFDQHDDVEEEVYG